MLNLKKKNGNYSTSFRLVEPAKPYTNKSKLDVSVIICAYTEKRWDMLVAAVQSLQRQTVNLLEIVLVIDHNPDLYACARAMFPKITVIENQQEPGLSGARNTGILNSRGAIVAFLDDDAIADPNWIEQLQISYADTDMIGTGGQIEPNWEEKRPQWFPEEFLWAYGCSYRGLPETTDPIRNPIGANMSFRREAFCVVGGFHNDIGRKSTGLLGSEETEFCIRLRQHLPHKYILYQPDAKVNHLVSDERATWKYFLKRCFYEGISKAMVAYLAGNASLGNEMRYTLYILPTGILNSIKQSILKRRVAILGRAIAIVLGLLATTLGFLWIKFSGTSMKSRSSELEEMAQANAAARETQTNSRSESLAAALYLLSNEAVQLARRSNTMNSNRYQNSVEILHDAYQTILLQPTDNPLDHRLQAKHSQDYKLYWGSLEGQLRQHVPDTRPWLSVSPTGTISERNMM